METTVRVLRYLVIVVIVAIFGGVAGWFFFVRSHQASISAEDDGRGLSEQTLLYTGEGGSNVSGVQEMPESEAAQDAPREIVRLWRADQGPVAGFSFVAQTTSATSSVHLYYVERANGYVFDADALSQTTLRLTNTLIPKTYEAVFSPKGSPVLLRSLEGNSITTLLASFATPSSTSTFPQALGGPTLPQNIHSIAVDPDPKGGLPAQAGALFYLAPSAEGGVLGMLSSLGNAKPTQVFSSPIASWRAQFARGKIFLLISPTDNLPGYAYTVASGVLTRALGPIPGLMALPHPKEDAILFSASSGGRLFLYAQVGEGAPTELPVQTVAEKCVWAPDLSAQGAAINRSPVREGGKSFIVYCAVPKAVPASGFIDMWYQGALHTSDTWWEIDAQNGTANEIFAPTAPIDVHDPQIDASGSYLAFTNGVDMSLWILRIVQ